MKIKISLVNEERKVKRNGRYSTYFDLSKQILNTLDTDSSKVKMVINPVRQMEIENIKINNHILNFNPVKQDVARRHWNIPIKVTLDKRFLNLKGENRLDFLFKTKAA